MRVTSKGQVTIPQRLREAARLLPDTEVEFELDGNAVRIFAAADRNDGRGARAVRRLRGSATSQLSTDEILRHTRR